jgi:TrmH family RNA methyltransferase
VTPDITSAANPHIRSLAELKRRRGRDAAGRFLIEGSRELGRAIDARIAIEEIILAPALASEAATRIAAAAPVPVRTVGEAPFGKVTVRQNPDGIIGVASTWSPGLDTIDRDLVLIAEAIEKPGNLGAMLRTADAAGAGVVVADPTVDPFNPNVVRASQGALFSVPVAVTDAAAARKWAIDRGPVFVTTPRADQTLWDADLTGAVAIVVGSEHTGVGEPWLEVGTPIRIPMEGDSDSLNASVAAAIVLFEAVRQRESSVHSPQSTDGPTDD